MTHIVNNTITYHYVDSQQFVLGTTAFHNQSK